MVSDRNKVLIRLAFTVGFTILLAFVLPQMIGLGAGGFDTEKVLTQYGFYLSGGLFLVAVSAFLLGLHFWNKGNEYGDSVAFVSQGRFPSLGFFSKFTSFQLILLSSIIFLIFGMFIISTGQTTFTGLRVLEHQFTPIGSVSYSALLIPLSENFGAAAVIAASIVLLTFFAYRYSVSRGNYRMLVLLGVPVITGLYGYVNHLLRYGSSDISLMVVFVFWFVGGLITVMVGSFIPFWIMHLVNNLLFDLQRFFASDTIRIYFIVIIILLSVIYAYLYVYRPKVKQM